MVLDPNYFQPVKFFNTIIGIILLASFSLGDAIISGFSGYADEARIIIQWTTDTENNVVGFEVQRSTDGHTFLDIGFLHAQGQNSGYTFIDDSIIAKVSGRDYFYRLKTRDMNGDTQISDVIKIQSSLSVGPRTWGSLKALFK